MKIFKNYFKCFGGAVLMLYLLYVLIVGIDFFNIAVRRKRPLFAKKVENNYCHNNTTRCQDKFVGVGYHIYMSVLDENGNIITDTCPSLRLNKYNTCTTFHIFNKTIYKDGCEI